MESQQISVLDITKKFEEKLGEAEAGSVSWKSALFT